MKVFQRVLAVCLAAVLGVVTITHNATATPDETECPAQWEDPGLYPHANDARYYWQCREADGAQFLRQCALESPGVHLFFNDDIKVCDWRRGVAYVQPALTTTPATLHVLGTNNFQITGLTGDLGLLGETVEFRANNGTTATNGTLLCQAVTPLEGPSNGIATCDSPPNLTVNLLMLLLGYQAIYTGTDGFTSRITPGTVQLAVS